MTRSFLILFTLLSVITACTQIKTQSERNNFNFNFEKVKEKMPIGWTHSGSNNYAVSVDSEHVKKGKYAVSVEYKEGTPDFKTWTFAIPNNYSGKKITLTGYIKTENVTEGYAGLWMRIDPNIAFGNMESKKIDGTTDWTKYSITLDMDPERTRHIVIGGLLSGKGKVWIDDLNVTIDGKPIDKLEPIPYQSFLAKKDKEFDKGSTITTISIEKNRIEDLKKLGLIWGFLKYYHPTIAQGKLNWDYELFRILKQINTAKDAKSRDQILVKWINQLGKIKKRKVRENEKLDIKIQPDLDWIKTAGFSSKLSDLLLEIKTAEKGKIHYYIEMQKYIGNPIFQHEKSYASNPYPDAGFRLLSLYRYWNMIQYYFPYKNLIEEDWKAVLEEFIPKVIEAKNKEEYTLTMLEVIARIHDTHANIWRNNPVMEEYKGVNYTAVKLEFIENQAVVTDFYDEKKGKETGLKIGDIITSINDKSIENIVKNALKRTPASNYETQLRDIASCLLRTNDASINVSFKREDKIQRTTLQAYDLNEVDVYKDNEVTDTCFRMIDENIAYLNNGSLKNNYLPKLWRMIKPTKGLIIDVRNYPSDPFLYNLSNYLMPKNIPFVKFTIGSIETPGLFSFDTTFSVGKENKNTYKGKIVIIVNETSQSSAEFHSMAYQAHPNAIVIGSMTAAADGNVSRIILPGGIYTMISGIGVYYPDGRETQRVGVALDREVKPTIKGIREGRDELMEKAIAIINED